MKEEMRYSTISDLLEKARMSPTVKVWEELIHASVSGRLNGLIGRHLGNIEEVLATAASNSADPLAVESFQTALENVVSQWNPAAIRSASSMESMLRLIQENLPRSGFVRLLGYLIDGGRFPRFSLGTADTVPQDLDDLAWETLSRYFPVAPKDPAAFPAFQTYSRYVQSQLANPARRTDACIRLIEIGQMLPEGVELGSQINSHAAEVVSGLVNWLLAAHRPDRNLLISEVYLHCQESQMARIGFETSLEAHGASVHHEGNHAIIRYREGESLAIPFTGEGGYERSLSHEWQDMSELGFFRLSEIAAEEDE